LVATSVPARARVRRSSSLPSPVLFLRMVDLPVAVTLLSEPLADNTTLTKLTTLTLLPSVEQQLKASLAKLGVPYVDLYYIHRVDVRVPIEVTMRTLSGFVKSGKIKYIGISEASAATIRRAHAVHPLAALQMEYSAFALEFEDENIGLGKACRDLGITVVA